MTGMSDRPDHKDPGKPEKPLTAAQREAKARGEPPVDWYYFGCRLGDVPGLAGVEGIEVGSQSEGPAAIVLPATAGPALDKYVRGLRASSVPPKGPASQAVRRQQRKEGFQPLVQKPVEASRHIVKAQQVTKPLPPEPPLISRLLREAEVWVAKTGEGLVERAERLDMEHVAEWAELLDMEHVTAEQTPMMIGTLGELLAADGLIAFVLNPQVWRTIRSHVLPGGV